MTKIRDVGPGCNGAAEESTRGGIRGKGSINPNSWDVLKDAYRVVPASKSGPLANETTYTLQLHPALSKAEV